MKTSRYKKYFANRKVTVMGLGILGRGLQVTQFLFKAGANVTVTDMKHKEDLKISLDKLKNYKIKYTLGKHDFKDFENRDMIMKSAGVPLDSPHILHAKKDGAEITMDASLFARIVRSELPNVKIVGITGTRGKSMTTALVYHLLESYKKKLGLNVFLGGNMRMKATLPILDKIQDGDIVVLELDSWQCQGFGDEKISPNISVFTNIMPDHMNYYKNSMTKYLQDKSYIYTNFRTRMTF
jgi:UDP-N-acetylmuramoylalanine--D-glutamate ligase